MQVRVTHLQGMHVACRLATPFATPFRAPCAASVGARRLIANYRQVNHLHTMHAAEQRSAGSEPSKVEEKGMYCLLLEHAFGISAGSAAI